jgi:DNA-binding SARP family transcriptional activator
MTARAATGTAGDVVARTGVAAPHTLCASCRSAHNLAVRFRVLGPLQVSGHDGRPVELPGSKPRALLTLLLSEPGRVVGIDRIVDTLWGDEPPPTATGTLQSYVSQLRRLLEPDRGPRQAPSVLLTRPPGYAVQVAPGDLDLLVFGELVEEGDRAVSAGEPARGVALLGQAMDLWRGEPLAELADAPDASTARQRIVELHVRAQERRCDALLALGRPEAAVGDLQQLVADHPLRERLWARLVTALYQADRQAEALDACRRCAELLREELGLDPGPELRDLERAVLSQDPRLLQRLPRPELPAPAARGPGPPGSSLVGRRPELAQLSAIADEVAAGSARVVVLEGEAGIGKTRLAEAAAQLARERGWAVAWSRCADEAGAPALWPWTQVLEQLGQPPLEPAVSDADADAARFQLFQDLCGRLGAAATTPVLVVLDDLQGADTTSVQLLGLLARHLRAPVLLVLTVRTVGEDLPSAVSLCLTRISREASTTRLVLDGLDAGEVSALLAAQLGTAGDRGLAEAVHDRTGGNPFFVVELSRWMVGARDLHLDRAPVPPSVRDVLRTRLARLPAETLEVLEVAAVLGREAGLDVLEAAGIAPEQAVLAMDTALALGLVVDGTAAWTWRFAHSLVQEVLVGDMSRLRRAQVHGRVAQALERQDIGDPAAPGDVWDERLAHHFVEASPVLGPAPALHWSVRAAGAARRRLAHDEAAAHTRRALGLLARAAPGGDPGRRLDLLVALGNDLMRSGHLLDAQQVVAEAIATAQAVGDRARLADAAAVWGGVTLWNWRPHGVVDTAMVALLEDLVGEDQARNGGAPSIEEQRRTARLLGTLGVELAFSEDLTRGVRHAERAVALARELGDPELLGRTLNNYGLAVWGRPSAAELRLAATDEALALVGHGLPRRTEFFARLHRAAIRLHLTDAVGFEADLAAARRLALSLSGPEVRPQVLWQAAGAAWLHGDAVAAEQLTDEAYALFRVVTPHARHAWAAHQFALRRAEGRLDTVLGLLVETGDEGSPLLREMAVLAAAEAGDPGEALRLRRRWGRTEVRDWASDVVVLLQAETALLLDDEPEWDAAVAALLPFHGRQAVLGTPAFSLGSYDELLGRFAEHRGDLAEAARWWHAAQAQARLVGSPHQLHRAAGGLSRLAG